eukprot:UN25523
MDMLQQAPVLRSRNVHNGVNLRLQPIVYSSSPQLLQPVLIILSNPMEHHFLVHL